MTLEELFEANGSKFPFKVTSYEFPPGTWTEVVGRSHTGVWVGYDMSGDSFSYMSYVGEIFAPYTEPKKMVKRWLWVTHDIDGSWVMSENFSDVSFGNSWIKLPWSETEFPE